MRWVHRPPTHHGFRSINRISACPKAGRMRYCRRLAIEPLEDRRLLAAYMVTISADASLPGPGTIPEPGTLRAAVAAVDTGQSGYDAIGFSVPTVDVTKGGLPLITNPITIDGGVNGVTIDGAGSGADTSGLYLAAAAGGCVVQNVAVFGFAGAQIVLDSNGNLVQDCYLGTTFGGKSAGPKPSGYGITIYGGGNTVENDVISGVKGYAGLYVLGSGAANNTIKNDFIGTDIDGANPIPNAQSGIIIAGGANNNQFYGNVISANKVDGVDIGGVGTSNNSVSGNYIGTNLGGTAGGKLGNGRDGVDIYGGATYNTIGGDLNSVGQTTGGNLISNNGADGVSIFDSDSNVTQNNYIEGNYIGTDIDGLAALPNKGNGVSIVNGAQANYIGQVSVVNGNHELGNLISGNKKYGVLIGVDNSKATPAQGNLVQANLIGTDRDGAVVTNGSNPLANLDGVYINGGLNNIIGLTPTGPVAGSGDTALPDPTGNIIAGNTDDGVDVASGTGNSISLNRIFGNLEMGIDLGAKDLVVGPSPNPPSGANNYQNYPVLTSVTDSGGQTTIAGTLILPATGGSGSYWIEFYGNSELSAKGGLSEGEWFLGAQQFSGGAGGVLSFTYTTAATAYPEASTAPTGPVLDHLITAIAIDGNGNTSEFSAARDVLRNAVANDAAQINPQSPQAFKAASAAHDAVLKSLPTNIEAVFEPNKILGVTPTIAQAAAYAGVDHFNWLQYITYRPLDYHILVPDPNGTITTTISGKTVHLRDTGTVLFYPVLDPIEDYPQQVYGLYNGSTRVGVINPGVPTLDGLPYYYDDKPAQKGPFGYITQQTTHEKLSGGAWAAGKMFLLFDAPTSQNLSGAGGTATFNSALVGVPFSNPATPVQWAGLNSSFQWVATTQSTFSGYLPGFIGPTPVGSSGPLASPAATDAALLALLKAQPTAGTQPTVVQFDGSPADSAARRSPFALGMT